MKLTVIFIRPSDNANVGRALASLDGAASEAVKLEIPGEDILAFENACRTREIKSVFANGHGIFIDHPGSYTGPVGRDLLPTATRAYLPVDLSELANIGLAVATGDYALVMRPDEVCLDPLNIERALGFLDTKKDIQVISCPTKIYKEGEHVRTVMQAKFFRVSPCVKMTGLLAANWEPCNDVNWLINASGLEFMDTGDGNFDQDLVDAQISAFAMVKKTAKEPPTREEEIDLAAMILPYAPRQALELGVGALARFTRGTTETARPLVVCSRAHLANQQYKEAIEAADRSIEVLPTPAGYLARGFARAGLHDGWRDDFANAIDLCRQTTSYGIDLRELRLAEDAIAWHANMRGHCPSNHGDGLDIPCLRAPEHKSMHAGLSKGARVEWETVQ